MESIGLYELNEYIQRVVALNFDEALWVHFELSNVKESRGHLYFECLEKSDAEIKARASGVIWARQFSFIKKKLGKISQDILQNGMVISAKVVVDFHPRYGFKLIIEDIDPAYTYGALALEKEKTWQRIQEEGLHQINTILRPPMAIQRIAIISNEQAAGFADFEAQLTHNSFGYDYDLTLFDSAVQGQMVQVDLPKQVSVINEESEDFDLVVVIRGGGSKLDLQAFDEYKVVKAIAECEVPVWVGVGHEIDESLTDLVASRSLKTPTAVASAINEWNYQFESNLLEREELLRTIIQHRIRMEDVKIDQLQYDLHLSIHRWIDRKNQKLIQWRKELDEKLLNRIKSDRNNLLRATEVLSLLDPESLLKKGFAIVEKDGVRVRMGEELSPSDSITIQFKDKPVQATID